MQAQALQTRRAIGGTWLVLAAAAVVTALLAVALVITLNGRAADGSSAKPVSITTVQDTGTGAYPGFVPAGAMAKHEARPATTSTHTVTNPPLFTPPLRKPFS
jgi:hypothetical protein